MRELRLTPDTTDEQLRVWANHVLSETGAMPARLRATDEDDLVDTSSGELAPDDLVDLLMHVSVQLPSWAVGEVVKQMLTVVPISATVALNIEPPSWPAA